MHPHGGSMQCEGPMSVIPKDGDSRQEPVYIHYEWEQESYFSIFGIDCCSIDVNSEKVMIILEGLHLFTGVTVGVEDCKARVRVGGVYIVVSGIGSPGYIEEAPPVPPFNVQDGKELGVKFADQGVFES